jgi:quinol monooxygenase YgiN
MTPGMARLTVVFSVDEGRSEAVVEALQFLMIATRAAPGCLDCGLWVVSDSAVRYLEEWATESDLRERVKSERFSSLLSLIESANHPPQVQFEFLTTTRGLDYVADVRGVPLLGTPES